MIHILQMGRVPAYDANRRRAASAERCAACSSRLESSKIIFGVSTVIRSRSKSIQNLLVLNHGLTSNS